MAVYKFIVIIYTFSCLCCGLCQLNLSEGAPCTTKNGNTGTCSRLFRCASAVLTYLYRNAGFTDDLHVPTLPEICSYRNEEPVVCCTDCVFSKNDEFKDSAVAPYGILVSRHGPKAWEKCLDYYQKLPYPCHGKGVVKLSRSWIEAKQCHNATLNIEVTVGGQDPQPWKFPHLALLGYGDTIGAAQWLCEGTVISERFILTAAHCTNAGVLGTIAYAALGLQNYVDPEKKWKIYNIKRHIIHPKYNEPSWYHNLALLETETEIRFDSDILPACLDVGMHDISRAEAAGLPPSNKNESNTKEVKPPTAKDMQTVFLDILDQKVCNNVYKPDNNLMRGYDHRIQMCYGVHNNTGDTCKRVSGSPLQIDQFRCQYTVVGVTGHAADCSKPEVPDIYTRIQSYVPWIESIVWPDQD